MLAIVRNILILFSAGILILLVGCASETQPLPDIDVAVEEKITEEIAKVVDTATPLPTISSQPTVPSRISSNELSDKLSAVCQLVSEERKVSCQPQRTSEDSSLKWSEDNYGTTSGSNNFEFSLNDPIAVKTLVTLEECINLTCTKVVILVDTSSLASMTSNTGSSTTETSDQHKGETEEVAGHGIMTMQSEYSQGRCDPNGVDYLDSPPMNTDEVTFIKPMGAFGGNHITPIDHMYVNYKPGTSHDVFAMADGHIVHMGHTGEDHRVIIEYSCDLYSIYIHIHELDPAIESQAEWVSPEGNSKGRSYSRIPVKSGMVIGRQIGNQSFDLSVVDTSVTLPGFVNLESYRGEFWKRHCVDPYDYWKGDFRQELLDKTIIINEDSPGGKIDYDVDGKLIGNWFEKDTGGYSGERDEDDYHGVRGHLAIVYSGLVRDTLVVSFGSFLDSGERRLYVKDNGPDPANIGTSSGLVRYELLGARQEMDREGNCCDEGFEVVSTGERWYGDTYPEGGLVATVHENPSGVVLIEMLDERTIKVETFNAWDGSRRRSLEETSEFTDNYKIYTR